MKNAPVLHRVEYVAYALVRGLLRIVSHSSARKLGGGLGAIAHLLLRSRRRVAEENMRLAMPELTESEVRRMAKKSFRHLGVAFSDPLSASRFDAEEFCRRLTLEGFEHLQAAEAKGKGVFVMSAHLGCWEAAAHVVGLYQGPMDVVGRPLDNPYLDKDLASLRARFGNRLLNKRKAARGILRVIRDGGRVGILIDQRSPDEDAVEVPFFGRPCRTSAALARMSMRTGAPVVPLFGTPLPDGKYRVVFREAVEPEEGGDSRDGEAVARLTTRYMEVVEREIRQQPELWMWLHRRWRP